MTFNNVEDVGDLELQWCNPKPNQKSKRRRITVSTAKSFQLPFFKKGKGDRENVCVSVSDFCPLMECSSREETNDAGDRRKVAGVMPLSRKCFHMSRRA